MPKEKYCSKCELLKSLEEFYNRNNSKDGKMSECKICNKHRVSIYQKQNKQKVNERIAIWIKNNPGKRKEYTQKNRNSHREQRREYDKKYCKTPHARLSRRLQNMRRRSLIPIQCETISEVLYSNNSKCVYCNRKVKYNGSSYNKLYANIDHIIPISKDGTNHRSNLALSCLECNQKKSNK